MEVKIIKILVINPGSTSTKIAIFEDEKVTYEKNIQHEHHILDHLIDESGDVLGQQEYRIKVILEDLKLNSVSLDDIDATVGRGGRLKPLESGTYEVTKKVLDDVPYPLVHPALLGTLIAKQIGDEYGVKSYFVDPTCVDEVEDIAKITGIKDVKRRVYFHALNHKAIGRQLAFDLNKSYEHSNIIVAHMGGGISVGAHRNGRVVDLTTPANGEGPIAPQRAGQIDGTNLMELAFSGKYTKEEIQQLFTSKGGLKSLLGTDDLREVERMITSGDKEAELIFKALAYQIAKHIYSMGAILMGQIDGIALTGGLAYSDKLVEAIKEYCNKLAPVYVYAGENEMLALAQGVIRISNNNEKIKIY